VSQPAFPGRELPFPSHPALYQVVREDPPPEDDPGGVVLINAFEVPPDGDDSFLAGWEQTRDVLRGLPGYLATRLHRSLARDARFRFVNVGRYQSPQAFQAAVRNADFQRGRGHPVPGAPWPVRGAPALSRQPHAPRR
jgi:heme-degrading monooxygenase HmoA